MSEEKGTTGADVGHRATAAQRRAVRERYAGIAAETQGGSGCCETDGDDIRTDADYAATLGYTDDDVDSVADGANLGLGCGNPTAIAGLEPGETVLDLGSGAGFDCFLAASRVGPSGQVIGVDMTPEMVERARANVERNDVGNVTFRLGEIEHLPVADGTVDVAISNCVVNLSPEKPQVFREVQRVLRAGGRVSISDVVLTAPIPEDLRGDPTSVANCVAGAATKAEVEAILEDAGFVDVAVEFDADGEEIVSQWDDERDLSEFVVSATITGRKPRGG